MSDTANVDAAAAPQSTPALAAHKFGGSSLADAACFRRVAAILRTQTLPRQLIVVSAMRGTTDALIALADAAVRAAPEWNENWQALRDRHLAAAR
ncbi:MAG: bifunctional aspartate kinase/homoserine dehydrogenase I, partial [Dokdonella sp.]